jgi:hypothetical protein
VKRLLLVGAVILIFGVLAVSTVRQLVVGARAVADCDAAIARGDRAGAVSAARAAAESAAPGSPYPERGYKRLETMAKESEARGDDEAALAAWRAMLTAATSTRAPGGKTEGWRSMAAAGIERIATRAADTARAKAEVRTDPKVVAEALRRDETVPFWTFLLLAAGAGAFFGALGRIAWIAAEPNALRRAKVPAIVAACGLILYVLAVARA